MSSTDFSETELAAEIENWKNTRVKNLTSETGWLTLCGLFWLKEGKNKVGTENDNEIILPLNIPPNSSKYIADIVVSNNVPSLEPVPGSELFILESNEKKLITSSTPLKHDDDGKQPPSTIQVDDSSVSFFIVLRGDKLAVRVKDSMNEARRHFKGLTYFALNPAARVTAVFHPYSPHKTLSVKTVLDMDTDQVSPGYLEFKWTDGNTYKIDTILEAPDDKEFFVILKDKTSGKETYGMRYMLVKIPDGFRSGSLSEADNTTIIDFNKLYNPPCCFTHFATCPLAPQQNNLPFRLEAGEKIYDH